ncbi:MAG: signal transduction histidine kinase, partial [Gemmataceae bacterium]|nr:signal transduction histidine kinase [Gemmataceae bacterium]
ELDGFQVARAIRERERATGGHLPVIALTARARSEDREGCLAAGMDDYLAKPVRAAELFAAIDRAVSIHAGRPTDDGGKGDQAGPPRPAPAGLQPDELRLLDPVVLLAACGGEAEGLHGLCEDFRAYAPARLAEMAAALRDRDAPRLRETAHKLCGLLSAFSTVAGNLASGIEEHAAGGDLDAAGQLVGEIEAIARDLTKQVAGLTLEALRRRAQLPAARPDGPSD